MRRPMVLFEGIGPNGLTVRHLLTITYFCERAFWLPAKQESLMIKVSYLPRHRSGQLQTCAFTSPNGILKMTKVSSKKTAPIFRFRTSSKALKSYCQTQLCSHKFEPALNIKQKQPILSYTRKNGQRSQLHYHRRRYRKLGRFEAHRQLRRGCWFHPLSTVSDRPNERRNTSTILWNARPHLDSFFNEQSL